MNKIRLLLSQFSGKNIIAIPTILVEMTQDWTLAAMLNQIIYWGGKSTREDGYVYKSLKDWEDELKSVTEYAVKRFKELPYVESKVMRANRAPTTHYRLNYDLFIKELEKYIPENHDLETVKTRNRNRENTDSLTENTTEITTDIKRDSLHREMIKSLEDVTALDMKIKRNAGMIVKASKELREAGYTPEQVYEFGKRWKTDWRYKQDNKPPTINVIMREISIRKSAKITTDDVEKRKELARKELLKNG